jgi:hypothetical protein
MTEIAASREEIEKAREELENALEVARKAQIRIERTLSGSRERRERREAILRRAGLLRD